MSQQAQPSLSVDAEGAGLIAAFDGRTPPAPEWFEAAIAYEPEAFVLTVEGARIEALAWGERGLPGLLLLHGNGAHAHWWAFIAPFFAATHRVVAVSWSGMGGSDWRETYHISVFAKEALAAAEAGGLFDGPAKPLVVGHSFGGFPALYLAARYGERLGGVVSLDSPIEPPGRTSDRPPLRSKPNRVYPTFNAALARFRLAPPQPCENLFAIDYIARRSLKEVEGGVTWRFDPFVWRDFELGDPTPLLHRPACPVAVMWGERSALMPPAIVASMREVAPRGAPFIAIPDAAHHVMLDQPLAFVAATRALFAAWP